MASAKQIRDEIMKLTIIVNSDPAQNEIRELAKANTEYRKEVEKLKQKKKELGKETEDNKKQHKELADEIKRLNSTIYSNNQKIEELRGGMEITKMTMGQLRKEAQLLRLQLRDVIPGSDAAKLLESQLSKVNTRISDVEKSSRNTQSSFQQLSSKFQQYSGIVTAVTAVLFGFGVSVQQIISKNNELSDAMSQVEKNANMTRQEVEALTRSFSDMDTRTKKIDLLKMATAGGKLGIAKEDIKDFVVEMDKANIALGDSWEGGADKIAEEIGRIALSYEETKNQPIAKSISEIGSALNELAADGASSESNIADFMNRLGSLPPSMKPPITTILGLGSALEESSIKAEIGSSGISKFFRVAGNNVEAFAEIMRRPVQEVKDLINYNPAEFFLQFSEGLKGLEATDVTQILEKLKLNDNEVQRVIGAATDKSERFREVIEKSNQAFKERTSLQIEFDKVNNNSAAIYEKLQKKLAEIFTSETFARFLNGSINALSLFLGVNEKAENSLGVFGRTFLTVVRAVAIFSISLFSLGATITAYNLLIKDSIAREIILNGLLKVKNTTTSISTIVQSGYNLVVGKGGEYLSKLIGFIALKTNSTKLETTATNLQTAAQERLNKVTKANPFGLIITVLSVAITAYITYKSLVEDTATAQEQLNEVLKEGAKNAGAEVNAIEQTYKKLTNKNIAEKERQDLLDKANKQYTGYFNNLSLEDFLLGKAVGQYNKLRDAIIASAQARAASDKMEQIQGKYLEDEIRLRGIIAQQKKKLAANNYIDETRTYSGQGGGGVYTISGSEKRMGDEAILDRARIELANLMKEKNALLYPLAKISQNDPLKPTESFTPNFTSNYKVPGSSDTSSTTTKATAEKNAHDNLMEQYKRQAEEAGKLSVDLEKEIKEKQIEVMEDGFAKELALIDEQERQKLAELEKKKITPEEIKKLQDIEAKATGTDKDFFKALLTQWETNNKQLEEAKTAEINYFANKRKALGIKYKNEELADANKSYEDKLALLERQKDDEINSFNTLEDLKKSLVGRASASEISQIYSWQKGKEALTKVYQKKELELHIAHLESMVKLYEGLDLTILDEKEREKVMKFITEAQNKIASLKAGEKGAGEAENQPKKLSTKGSTDLLGLSKDDWEALFNNLKTGDDLIGTISASIELLKNAFNSYYSLVQAKEQAQLRQVEVAAKRKEKALKKQLDSGMISQDQYEARIQKLNEETDKKKWELEVQAAKRQRTIQIITTIANTAQSVMNMLATAPWPVNLVMAGVATAMGALQVATIMKTPLPEAPGYEQGFGIEEDVVRQQDGKRFRAVRRRLTSGLVDRPTHFLAGENGVEMVIDSPTYTKFPESVKRTINQQIAVAKGYEGGRYPYLSDKSSSNSNELVLIDALERNTQAMNSFVNKDWTARVDKNDMRSAKNIIDMQDDYNYLKNK